jgi:transglutaminase-like putative cysteine protease
VAVVAIAVATGAALAASTRIHGPRFAGPAARVAIVAVGLAAALLATGLRARLLLPGGWDELGAGLDDGLAATSSAVWPYGGEDAWLRQTLLLGLPALAVPAAALAFWPARRAAGALRLVAIALLVALYAVPATERDLGDPVGRGVVLLLLAAACLWLPRLRLRDAIPAAVAVAVAGLVAMPIAAGLDERDRWIDYERWALFGEGDRGKSTTFDWTHNYGPIDWTRSGVTLLTVRSPEPHYWKAQTLDRFDGLRWRHSGASRAQRASSELPREADPRWNRRVDFSVRALRSRLLVGAGTILSVSGALTSESGDGTYEVIGEGLERGDEYSVLAYVPDPTPAQMRAAPTDYPGQLQTYTFLELPAPGESAFDRGEPPFQEGRMIGSPAPGIEPGAAPHVRRRILDSPHRRVYLLARRLATGQATTYDVVRNVERHLERGYVYNERPPPRPLPLDSFLFEDRAGYCQQFSGAMALLLRMNGIPARVASGFTPGIEDTTTHEFRVRDMDAHSWVEVWFSGIGWVAFDPTPTTSPAALQQADDEDAAGGAGGDSQDEDSGGSAPRTPGIDAAEGGAETGGGGRAWGMVALVLLPLVLLAALWGAATVRARRVGRGGGDPDVRELVWALERLGHPLAPGTTLLALERRLDAVAGPAAARYARVLRERRFAPAGSGSLDRRGLRRALVRGRGVRARARALLALPPRRARPSN